MKECKICKIEKAIKEYDNEKGYILTYCKECRREKKRLQARLYREKNREKIRKNDKIRYLFRTEDDRVKANDRTKKYRKTEHGKKKIKEYRERNKKKLKVRWTTANAIRDGKLKRAEKCTLCNSCEHIEAHHPDYEKPLEVIWLCKCCHTKIHT